MAEFLKILGFTKHNHCNRFDENYTAATELSDWLHQVYMNYVNDKTSTSKKDIYYHVKQTAQATLQRMKD